MLRGLLRKFSTHSDIREMLLSTGDEELVEKAPTDYYWGCGKSGTGRNRLGVLLMEVRKQLRTQQPSTPTKVGVIGWVDLTVENAGAVQDFYSQVVGWTSTPVDMGGYDDFTMIAPSSGQPAAGICHARSVNADLPAQWLIYIQVEDLDASIRRCIELGGRVLSGPTEAGEYGRYCVIQDPVGAVAALSEAKP